jgi:hypothetical protein
VLVVRVRIGDEVVVPEEVDGVGVVHWMAPSCIGTAATATRLSHWHLAREGFSSSVIR